MPATRITSPGKHALVFVLMAMMAWPSSAERLDFVPRQFQGTWTRTPGQCDRPVAIMQISQRAVLRDGRHGRIRVVIARGRFEAALVTESSDGARPRLWAHSFVLSSDEARLVDSTQARGEVWFKCPMRRAASPSRMAGPMPRGNGAEACALTFCQILVDRARSRV
jgi:hypothetical protein